LNEFELKRFEFEKSLKKGKKEKDLTSLSNPAGPPAHFSLSRSSPPSSPFFFFLCVTDEPTPPAGASFSFLPPFPLLCFADRVPPQSSSRPAASFPFPF
jgi:hypothetical protein